MIIPMHSQGSNDYSPLTVRSAALQRRLLVGADVRRARADCLLSVWHRQLAVLPVGQGFAIPDSEGGHESAKMRMVGGLRGSQSGGLFARNGEKRSCGCVSPGSVRLATSQEMPKATRPTASP